MWEGPGRKAGVGAVVFEASSTGIRRSGCSPGFDTWLESTHFWQVTPVGLCLIWKPLAAYLNVSCPSVNQFSAVGCEQK